MNWLSFLLGLLVAWLVEWLIDFFYWRRKNRILATQSAQSQARVATLESRNEELGQQLADMQAQMLIQTRSLSECQAKLALRPALASRAPEPLVITPEPRQPDDLRKIEGIGPKIAQILQEHDILTFADLAATAVDRLRTILEQAGPRYALAKPDTWPKQAELAARGDWDALKDLQNRLDGGRLVDDHNG